MGLRSTMHLALFASLSAMACATGAVSPVSNGDDVGGTSDTGMGGKTSVSKKPSGLGGANESTSTADDPDDSQGDDESADNASDSDGEGGSQSTGGRQSSTSQGGGGATTHGNNGGAVNGNGGKGNAGSAQAAGSTGKGGNTTTTTSGGKGGAPSSTSAGSTCVDTPRSSESCSDAKSWGFCSQTWFAGYCQATCATCGATSNPASGSGQGGANGSTPAGAGGSSSSSSSSGSSSGSATLQPISGGQNAWASRYWDCCKPACGWTGNTGDPVSSCDKSNNNIGVDDGAKNACENGGSAYMCWSGVPHSLSDSVSYAFAAASGSNYKCGQCFQIQFDGGSHNGSSAGTQALKGKQMIVQVVNNGGVAADQFDLLIPGGGVGALNACSTQWGSSDLGAQYGGFLGGCNGDTGCVQNKCNTVFAGKTDLLAGCSWFLSWFHAADNPTFQYKAVTCPSDFNSVMGGLNK